MDTKASATDLDRVDKVVRLVATSPVSWADATRIGVRESAKTITDLRTARLLRADTVVDGSGAVSRYRVTLEVSFRLDRRRGAPDSGQPQATVRRYLVVANQTLANPALVQTITERIGAGPAELHIVVPVTTSPETRAVLRAVGDPLFGGTAGLEGLSKSQAHDRNDAERRLAEIVARLTALGAASVSAELGRADPFDAVAEVMGRASFDEIIVSTLPAGISRWLGLDLPSRIERAFGLPTTTITAS